MKKSTAKDFFDRRIDPETEKFVNKSLDISLQVQDYLEKLGWTQKELAQKMGKTEAEISKWLSGMHNLTLKSIAKMEIVLGRDIIITPGQINERATEMGYESKIAGEPDNSSSYDSE